MKIRVSHSESIQVSDGHWVKDEIDVELNNEFDGQFSETTIDKNIDTYSSHLRKKIVEIVKKWHSEDPFSGNPIAQVSASIPPSPPIIDRSIERLEIMIDDCKTKEELLGVYEQYNGKIETNTVLHDMYCTKLEILNK